MVYKKFSRSLYEENDEIAKKVACEYLLSTNTFRLITDIKSQKEQFKLYDFEILYIVLLIFFSFVFLIIINGI